MPPEHAGVASATVGASRQLGAILGVAVMGSLAATRMHHLLATGTPRDDAFTVAAHAGYLLGLGSPILATAIATTAMSPRTRMPRPASVAVDRK